MATTTARLLIDAVEAIEQAEAKLDRISLAIEGAAITLGANDPRVRDDEQRKIVERLDSDDESFVRATDALREAQRWIRRITTNPNSVARLAKHADPQFAEYAKAIS